MGKKMTNDIIKAPSVCIIDDSPMTAKLYSFLFHQLLINPLIQTYTHPFEVSIKNLRCCDLIVIDEIMEGMTGTNFIYQTIKCNFESKYHLFPNVIFVSSLDPGDIHERVKSLNLDHMIPAYRVLEKPLIPAVMKATVMSICPDLHKFIDPHATTPNPNLPWGAALRQSFYEIVGIKNPPPCKHCVVSL
jgi:CheY-like chemotaxis protein